MNPGFISYIAVTLTAILIWSGWRSLLSGGFSSRGVYLFLLCWVAGSVMEWQQQGFSGSLVYVSIFALILAVLSSSKEWHEMFSVIAFGLLLAAVGALIELINFIDPFVLAAHPVLNPLFVIPVLPIAYSRKWKIQLALVSVALIVKDAYLALLFKEFTTPVFGGEMFQDEWWITSAVTRSLSILYVCVSSYGMGLLKRLFFLLKIKNRS